jgi:uncharacterized membrane protein
MVQTVNGDDKMKGALAYLLGPVTGVILLLIEKKSAFVRFHAMQSTVLFGAFFIINVALGIIPVLGWILAIILSPLLMLLSFILWLVLMYKAYSGEMYKLPYIGEFAVKQLGKLK